MDCEKILKGAVESLPENVHALSIAPEMDVLADPQPCVALVELPFQSA
jgi:hypothetical protein